MDSAIPSWSVTFEQRMAELSRFEQFLRPEDRAIFDDLITQCRLYASAGEIFASPVKEMSLLFLMVFAQHKKLTELGKRINERVREAR